MCDVSIWQKNLSLHSPNWSSAEGQRKSRNSTTESTRRPCLGMGAKAWHQNLKQPCLHLTLQNVQKKQLLTVRNLKSRRFKKQFLQFGCISVCLGICALFGTFWGLPDLVGSTKMSNGQPLAALAASSRRPQGAWCVELQLLCLQMATFWGWKSDS